MTFEIVNDGYHFLDGREMERVSLDEMVSMELVLRTNVPPSEICMVPTLILF